MTGQKRKLAKGTPVRFANEEEMRLLQNWNVGSPQRASSAPLSKEELLQVMNSAPEEQVQRGTVEADLEKYLEQHPLAGQTKPE